MKNEITKFDELYYKVLREAKQTQPQNKETCVQLFKKLKQVLSSYEITGSTNIKILSKLLILANRLTHDSRIQQDLNKAFRNIIKLNQSQAELITEQLSNNVSVKSLIEFTNYLINNENRLNINDYLGQKIKIESLINATGLTAGEKVFEILFETKFNTIPAMGRRLVIFSLFI